MLKKILVVLSVLMFLAPINVFAASKSESAFLSSDSKQSIDAYDFRVVFWGCSTLKHGEAPSIGWYHNWGMAATSEDKDFAHRFLYYLSQEYKASNIDYKIDAAGSTFDNTIENEKNAEALDVSNYPSYASLVANVRSLQPNVIVMANLENVNTLSADLDCVIKGYSQLIDELYEEVPDAVIIFQSCMLSCRTFHHSVSSALQDRYSELGKHFVVMHTSDYARSNECKASQWLPEQPGVAGHYNDKGMDEVGKQFFDCLVPFVGSAIEPTGSYFLPDSLEILGQALVTEKGVKSQYTVSVLPDDSYDGVDWSVNNTNIATIDENGVLTAKNNGKVTIKAKCNYSDVCDTFDVTVRGQSECYTITYNAGTSDTVSGLPESDPYANGSYLLSDAIPLRQGYIFAGWSKTYDGARVSLIDVSENTTVYAIWNKVSGYEFNGNYPEDKSYTYGLNIIGGFHNSVENGRLTTICTAGQKVKFTSPTLDIENRGYMSFALQSGYFDEESKIEVVVKLGEGQTTKSFALTTSEMRTYVVDTSTLDGSIDYFEIYVNAAKSDNSQFTIRMDYIRFAKEAQYDSTSSFGTDTDNAVISVKLDGFAGKANVFGALYDSENRLSDIRIVQITGYETAELHFDKSAFSSALFAKVYVLDENFKPVVNAYTSDVRGNDTFFDVGELLK